VLFRRLVADPAGAAARLLKVIEEHDELLHGLQTVITPGRTRVRRLVAPDAD
jgi:hypothetical protein